MLAGARPGDQRRAAAHLHAHLAVQQPLPASDRDRAARSGAAGQRLADAALEYAQSYLASVDDLHETRVDALWKPGVMLDLRSELIHRRRVDIGNAQHGMRIADGDGADFKVRPVDL